LLHFHHIHFYLTWFPFTLKHQLVVSVMKFYTICKSIIIQELEFKKFNSVLKSEVNMGCFVGHIHLDKFLINVDVWERDHF
jgi:hypothetical protein